MSRGGVVITGASSGIGRACALDLDRRGFRVFGGVRSDADAEALRAAGSERLVPLKLDVTGAGAIAEARDTVEERLSGEPLAGIVNNAGIAVGGPLELVDVDDVRRQLEINTVAPVAVTQAFIPRLRADHGRVVMMSSIGGRIGQPFIGPYSASKFALEALSDALRRELMPWGIQVAIVEPGTIKTRIWEKGTSQLAEMRATKDPERLRLYETPIARMDKVLQMAARRGASPEKVARAVHHALTAERPRTRYLVGADAKVQRRIDAALPARVMDRAFARITGTH